MAVTAAERPLAVVVPRVVPRDPTLLPAHRDEKPTLPRPETFAGLSHLIEPRGGWSVVRQGDPFARELPSSGEASSWIAERIEAGDRVYATDLHLIVGVYLWMQQTEGPLAERSLELIDWICEGRLVSLDEAVKTVEAMTGLGSPEIGQARFASELLETAERVDRFFHDNQVGSWQDWPADAHSLLMWTRQVGQKKEGRQWPAVTGPFGLLGTGATVLGRAVGTAMSWNGIAANPEAVAWAVRTRLEGPEAQNQSSRDSIRRQKQASINVRPDGRFHPYYSVQKYHRLEAQAPAYELLSGRAPFKERALLQADEGHELYSLDITQAELYVTGVVWKRLFGNDKLLERMASTDEDVHERTGRLLAEALGQDFPTHDLRSMGKTVNFAFGNLAQPESQAQRIGKKLGIDVPSRPVERVFNQVSQGLPFVKWKDLCRRIAFVSTPYPKAEVPTILGRWMALYPKRRGKVRKKPAPHAVASAFIQSPFADLHAWAMLKTWQALMPLDALIVGTVYDELLISAASPGILETAKQAYLGAIHEIFPEPGLAARIVRHGRTWS